MECLFPNFIMVTVLHNTVNWFKERTVGEVSDYREVSLSMCACKQWHVYVYNAMHTLN